MIKNLFNEKKTVYSLEAFPPKKDSAIQTIFNTLDEVKELNPDFISVTYGAGGSNSKKTLEIAHYIQNECKIEAVAHLTCAALTEDSLRAFLDEIRRKNVKNVLALRGDKPLDMTEEQFEARHFKHASDLINAIDKHPLGTIAGACYPEIHYESKNRAEDMEGLRKKVEAGADILISQLFYDNDVFYRFMEALRNSGIEVPVSAGIMPVTAASQIRHSVELSGAHVPVQMSHMLARYKDSPEDLYKAGIAYAIGQIEDLKKHGVQGIHLYSMNKAKVTREIYDAVMG